MIRRFSRPFLILSFFLLILVLTMSCSKADTYPPQDWKEENPASDFDYSLTEDGTGIVINGFIGDDFWEVVIPEFIDGLPVVEIADFAFYSHNGETVSCVCMPDTVERIGKEVFYYSNLVSVRLSENLKSIGAEAFIGTGLTDIQLPASLEELDHTALQFIPSLTDILVEENPRYSFENGLLMEDGVVIVYPGGRGVPNNEVPGGQGETHIDIPTGAVGIDADVFKDRIGIESVTIPNTVTFLGYNAFSGCTSLKDINFKEGGLVSLEGGVFSGCTSLASVRIAAYSLGDFTFSGCTALTNVELMPGLYSIGRGSFSGCSSLKELPLPPGLAYINARAFYGTDLHSLRIPDSILQIEPGEFYHGDRAEAFFGMPSLTEVIIGTSPVYRMDGNRLVMDNRVLFDPRFQENWYEFDEMKAVADGLMAYRIGDKWGLLSWALGKNTEPKYDGIDTCACLGENVNIGVKDGWEYKIGPNGEELHHQHNSRYQKEYIYWDEEDECLYDEEGQALDMMAEGWACIGAFPIGANGNPYPDAEYILVDMNDFVVGDRYISAYSDLETGKGTSVLVFQNGWWYVYDWQAGLLDDQTFTDARQFHHGFAAIRTDKGWGFINSHGIPVTDFIYDDVTDMVSSNAYPFYAYGKKDGLWQPIYLNEDAADLRLVSDLPTETAPPPEQAGTLDKWRDRGLPLFIKADFGYGQQSYYALDFLNGLLAFKGLGASLGNDGTQQLFLYGDVIEDRTEYKFYEPKLQNGIWYLEEYDLSSLLDEVIWWYITDMAEDQRAEQDVIIDEDTQPAIRMDHVADAFQSKFFNNVIFMKDSPLNWSYSINGGSPQPLGEHDLIEWNGDGYMEMDSCLALVQSITNLE